MTTASQHALYGRDQELERLRGLLENVATTAAGAHGRVVLLAGASGVGKSALAQATMDHASDVGFEVFRIACEPFHDGMSFFPVRELVRQMADGRAVGDAVADLFGASSPQAEMAAVCESVTADPSSRREAMVATFTNAIVGRFTGGEANPVLLFLDDLEHLDAASADALICLVSRMHEGPVVVLGAYRTDIVTSSSHPLKPVITSARRAEGVLTLVELDGFKDDAISALTEVMLGGECELPGRFYDKLARETEGNPLFIREVLRTLRSQGQNGEPPQLEVVDNKWTYRGSIKLWAIPASVEDVIAARLDQLESDQRNELEVAAVVGRRFAFEVLSNLIKLGEDELLDHLEEFLNVDIIRELDRNDETFEFSHGKIRDVLYESLSGLRRRRIHAQVARVFREMVGTTNEDWDALIGRHLFAAAAHHEAFPYLLNAARAARSTGSAKDAVELFRMAHTASDGAVLAGNDTRQSIQLELASALIATSETTEAGALLEQLTRPDVPLPVRALALDFLGDSLLFEGDVDHALETYKECEALARSADLPQVLCEVACDLSELHGRQYERLAGTDAKKASGHHELHLRYVQEAFDLRSTVSDPSLQARVLRNKAKRSRVDGNLPEALELYRQSIASVDDRVAGHRFLIPYAKTLRLSGQHDEALAVIARVLSWATQVGSRRSEAIGWQYNGMFLMTDAGGEEQLVTARESLQKAVHLHRIIRYEQGLHETELLLAEVELRLGRRSEAIAHLVKAIAGHEGEPDDLIEIGARELEANGERDRAEYLRSHIANEAA